MENQRSDSVWRRGFWSAEAGDYSGKGNEFLTREIAEMPREFGNVETETSAGYGNSGEWSTTEECARHEQLENSDENGSGNSSETETGKLAPVVQEAIAAATENNSPISFGKLETDWMDHFGSLRGRARWRGARHSAWATGTAWPGGRPEDSDSTGSSLLVSKTRPCRVRNDFFGFWMLTSEIIDYYTGWSHYQILHIMLKVA